jgi:hypothetical protein
MPIVLAIVGALIVVGECFVARSNRSASKQAEVSSAWLHVYRWRWLVGVVFAIASAFIGYPVTDAGERYRVLGVPFLAAAFDSGGRDYVGPLTLPAFVANTVVWFFLPQIVLFCWMVFTGRRPQTPNQALQPTAGRSDV